MYAVLSLVIPVFGLIFLGYIARKTISNHERGLDWLSTFVIYFALPALFFKLLSQTSFEELSNWKFIAATTFTTFIVFSSIIVLSVVVARATLGEAAIRGVAAAYGNIGYMGPGLALAALGPEAAAPTTLIICFDNLLFFAGVPLLVALGDSQGAKVWDTACDIAKKVLLHPFILASVAGVVAAYFRFEPPAPIMKLIDYLSDAAAPCALFALGVIVAGQPLKRVSPEIPLHLIVKLILHPILVILIVGMLVRPDEIWFLTAVLLASLPPAANVFVLAQQYGLYVQRASSTILIGTLISIVTISVVIYMIKEKIIGY